MSFKKLNVGLISLSRLQADLMGSRQCIALFKDDEYRRREPMPAAIMVESFSEEPSEYRAQAAIELAYQMAAGSRLFYAMDALLDDLKAIETALDEAEALPKKSKQYRLMIKLRHKLRDFISEIGPEETYAAEIYSGPIELWQAVKKQLAVIKPVKEDPAQEIAREVVGEAMERFGLKEPEPRGNTDDLQDADPEVYEALDSLIAEDQRQLDNQAVSAQEIKAAAIPKGPITSKSPYKKNIVNKFKAVYSASKITCLKHLGGLRFEANCFSKGNGKSFEPLGTLRLKLSAKEVVSD